MPEKNGLAHGKSDKTALSVDCFANNRFFISKNEQKAEGGKENFGTIAQTVAGQQKTAVLHRRTAEEGVESRISQV